MSWTGETLERIEKCIRACKPKLVDGKGVYLDQKYTSLDDAWDYYDDDLQTIRDIRKGEFDFILMYMEDLEKHNG